MLQNQQYRSDYVAFITDMIDKGYAEKGYPKKPKKIGVVFGCSARYGGTSLNDRQGPDMTNSLVGVLTRFRQEPVAFMSDVEAVLSSPGSFRSARFSAIFVVAQWRS